MSYVQVQISGGADFRVHAGGLVVLLDGNLSVTHRDLYLAGSRVAFVAAVENEIIAGHQSVAQLCVNKGSPALLICVCHKIPLFLRAERTDQTFRFGFSFVNAARTPSG